MISTWYGRYFDFQYFDAIFRWQKILILYNVFNIDIGNSISIIYIRYFDNMHLIFKIRYFDNYDTRYSKRTTTKTKNKDIASREGMEWSKNCVWFDTAGCHIESLIYRNFCPYDTIRCMCKTIRFTIFHNLRWITSLWLTHWHVMQGTIVCTTFHSNHLNLSLSLSSVCAAPSRHLTLLSRHVLPAQLRIRVVSPTAVSACLPTRVVAGEPK